MSLDFNTFSGTFPSDIGLLSNLQNLYLQDNFKPHGSLPTSIGLLKKLEVIVLSNNQFSGHIRNEVFDPSTQTSLTTIDISGNHFTGPIPETLFLLPNIQTITLGKNCYTGTLPSTICSAKKMVDVKLNNLGGLYQNTMNATDSALYNEACPIDYPWQQTLTIAGRQYDLFVNVASGLFGTIPACVFNISSLRSLYISGSGMTGTIPSGDFIASTTLTTLSLSFNNLNGTIPEWIQKKTNFAYLDLSYNHIGGTVSPTFQVANNATVVLNNNRLSGSIPPSVVALPTGNVNVLSGNLFVKPLPPADPSYAQYSPGSNQFLFAIIIFCFVCFLLVCIALFGAYFKRVDKSNTGDDEDARSAAGCPLSVWGAMRRWTQRWAAKIDAWYILSDPDLTPLTPDMM